MDDQTEPDFVDLVDNLTNELQTNMYEFFLVPRRWSECCLSHMLDWREMRLTEANRGHIPKEPGIYTLIVEAGIVNHPRCSYLMYVGKSDDLRRRFAEYLGERRRRRRPKVFRLLNRYGDRISYCYASLDSEFIDAAEAALLEALVPPCNSDFPGDLGTARRAF